jgi:hypothetical protein
MPPPKKKAGAPKDPGPQLAFYSTPYVGRDLCNPATVAGLEKSVEVSL